MTSGDELKDYGAPVTIDVSSWRWMQDLQVFDGGPLLSVLQDTQNRKYLLHWVDSDERHNRWLGAAIEESVLVRLLDRRIAILRALQATGNWCFLFDLNDQGEFSRVFFVDFSDLPSSYLPDAESYLNSVFVPTASLTDDVVYSILLEGNGFSLEAHEGLPKSFVEVYAFLAAEESGHKMESWPHRGGYSAVNEYRRLRAMARREAGLKIVRYEYHSPGILQFRVKRELIRRTCSALDIFRSNRNDIDGSVKEIRRYIRKKKLNQPETKIESNDLFVLSELGRRLADRLGHPRWEWLSLQPLTAFQACKSLVFHVGRMERLLSYEEMGLISLTRPGI